VILFLTGMALILKSWTQFGVLLIILVILSVALYFNWFRHLSTEVEVE